MNDKVASDTVKDLLNIRAVQLSTNPPFVWNEEITAPIYTDNRLTMAYPRIRERITKNLAQLVREQFPEATVICGVPTAGIAYAALVSDRLELPFIYVHADLNHHGLIRELEGKLTAEDKVVLIDDLIASGAGSTNAAAAVRETGATVLGIAAIFSYQLPDVVRQLERLQLKLFTLTDYTHLIEEAVLFRLVDEDFNLTLKYWHENPTTWLEKFGE